MVVAEWGWVLDMREIDVFKDVIRNMVEGTMFHNQTIQYFEYLGLNGFAELQKIRFEDENNEMVKLQRYIVEVYGVVVGDINPDSRNYIPQEWSENLRENLENGQVWEYVKFGIETWKDWESKSRDLYGKKYFELSDLRDAGGSERIMKVVNETEMEMRFAYELMCLLRGTYYNSSCVSLLDDKIVKMYKRFYKKGEM